MINDSKNNFKQQFQRFLLRPGMYISEIQYDYFINFLNGWSFFDNSNVYSWDSNYDIQHWLFLNESVSINASSIHGHSLMQRCYGNDSESIEQLKNMVEEIPFSFKENTLTHKSVSCHIRQVVFYYLYGNNDICKSRSSNISQIDGLNLKNMTEILKNTPATFINLVTLVKRILPPNCKDLWIYICRDSYFIQFRCLAYTEENGWQDNCDWIYQEHYYANLVLIHAFINIMETIHEECRTTVIHSVGETINIEEKSNEDIWFGIFNNNYCISRSNENNFYSEYTEWKNKIIASLSQNGHNSF